MIAGDNKLNPVCLAVLALLVIALGCDRKADDPTPTSPVDVVSFVRDTITLDHVPIGATSSSVSAFLYNPTQKAVVIERVTATCGCTSVKPTEKVIPAKGKVRIDIDLNLSKLGPFDHKVAALLSNGETSVLRLRGTVEDYVDIHPQFLDMDELRDSTDIIHLDISVRSEYRATTSLKSISLRCAHTSTLCPAKGTAKEVPFATASEADTRLTIERRYLNLGVRCNVMQLDLLFTGPHEFVVSIPVVRVGRDESPPHPK